MKNVVILHGTANTSKGNWFMWLKEQLERQNYHVWVPDLPHSEQPNIERYNHFLLSHAPWQFDEHTIIIGHSSGAVAILGLLQALPENTSIEKAILVGAFKDDLGRDDLKELFDEPFDFEKIKYRAKKFVFIHSDNDPHCPLEGAKFLVKKLNGELYVRPGEQHFSISAGGEKFKQFPFILSVI